MLLREWTAVDEVTRTRVGRDVALDLALGIDVRTGPVTNAERRDEQTDEDHAGDKGGRDSHDSTSMSWKACGAMVFASISTHCANCRISASA